MSKKYLSSADFLAGITCQPVDFEVAGLGWIQVRSLTTFESGTMHKEHAGDGVALMLHAVQTGLVTPHLTREEIEQLGQSRVGVIQKISEFIMQLSGLTDDKDGQEDLEKKAGDGSL